MSKAKKIARLTFGEKIEITYQKDLIRSEIQKDAQFSDKIITFALRKIASISKNEANRTITELGLDKKGWRPE